VVDDGSSDATAAAAEAAHVDRVVRLPRRTGKGSALAAGLREAQGQVFVLLDADLEASAEHWPQLVAPLLAGEADLVVGVLPPMAGGGFGLVRRLAGLGTRLLTGKRLQAPLSGQRALTRAAWERIGDLDPGWGAEVGMTIDALRAGLRVVEVPVAMRHRPTGRGLAGFRHRGRQLRHVLGALCRRMHPPQP